MALLKTLVLGTQKTIRTTFLIAKTGFLWTMGPIEGESYLKSASTDTHTAYTP
jgi:hypothetical protein